MHAACVLFAHHKSNIEPLSLPQIQLLCKENLLTKRTLQLPEILDSVKKAICRDYKNLKKFVDILCKSHITVEVGNAIMKDYGKFLSSMPYTLIIN